MRSAASASSSERAVEAASPARRSRSTSAPSTRAASALGRTARAVSRASQSSPRSAASSARARGRPRCAAARGRARDGGSAGAAARRRARARSAASRATSAGRRPRAVNAAVRRSARAGRARGGSASSRVAHVRRERLEPHAALAPRARARRPARPSISRCTSAANSLGFAIASTRSHSSARGARTPSSSVQNTSARSRPHAPLVDQPRQPAGAGQHREQRQLGQAHRRAPVVDEQDALARERQLVAAAARRAARAPRSSAGPRGARVLDREARLVGELAEVHLQRVRGARQHADVRARAEHVGERALDHARSATSGCSKRSRSHRVAQLDVDAQVVAVALQRDAVRERAALVDREREPRDAARRPRAASAGSASGSVSNVAGSAVLAAAHARLLAQHVAADLARRGLGQLVDEVHAPRILVRREARLHELLQLARERVARAARARASTTNARGLVRPCSSDRPTTAASTTAACATSAASTSTGETYWPLTFMQVVAPADVPEEAVGVAPVAVARAQPAGREHGARASRPAARGTRARRSRRARAAPRSRRRPRRDPPRRRCARRSPAPACRSSPARAAPGRFDTKM